MTFGKLIRGIAKPFYKVLYRLKIEGLENFDMEKPFVLCANHQSNWDVVALYIAAPRQMNFLAKIELFKNKLFGWLLKKLGAIPINRETNDLNAIKTALRVLKEGEVLAIFPQGTRTDSVEDDTAKAGAVVIAVKSNVPIMPVYIDSKYKLFRKTVVKMGKPIYIQPEGKRLTPEETQNAVNRVMGAIRDLKEGDSHEN